MLHEIENYLNKKYGNICSLEGDTLVIDDGTMRCYVTYDGEFHLRYHNYSYNLEGACSVLNYLLGV